MARASRIVICCVTGMLISPMSLEASPLKVVNVKAPDINCVFNAKCSNVVTDTVSTFSWPSYVSATGALAELQSRTFLGKATEGVAVPGAGKTAYLYRVIAKKGGSTDCVLGLVMDFGPISQLDYNKSGINSDIFVITSGGIGSVGIKSADKVGNKITVNFTQGICNTVTQSSYFFGLTSNAKPKTATIQANVIGIGSPSLNVGGRLPINN